MAAKKFGYVRVSTQDQNPERQIRYLQEVEGIDERDIYVEKESGRKFERPVYRYLVDHILRPGDMLVVTELKRFGRNYQEIYREWYHITKDIGADIKAHVEMSMDRQWYLVGLPGLKLDGLEVRRE